jgi:hypothetical protein
MAGRRVHLPGVGGFARDTRLLGSFRLGVGAVLGQLSPKPTMYCS